MSWEAQCGCKGRGVGDPDCKSEAIRGIGSDRAGERGNVRLIASRATAGCSGGADAIGTRLAENIGRCSLTGGYQGRAVLRKALAGSGGSDVVDRGLQSRIGSGCRTRE